MVKSPTDYDPTHNPGAAKDRRDTVHRPDAAAPRDLSTRRAEGRHEGQLGLHVPSIPNGCLDTKAPWFCEYLLSYLHARPGARRHTEAERNHHIFGGGLTIKTTVDLRYQLAADKAVSDHVLRHRLRAVGALAMVEPRHRLRPRARAVAADGQRQGQGRDHASTSPCPTRVRRRDRLPGRVDLQGVRAVRGDQAGHPAQHDDLVAPGRPAYLGGYRTCAGNYPSTETLTFHNSTDSGTKDMYTGTQESVNTFLCSSSR